MPLWRDFPEKSVKIRNRSSEPLADGAQKGVDFFRLSRVYTCVGWLLALAPAGMYIRRGGSIDKKGGINAILDSEGKLI